MSKVFCSIYNGIGNQLFSYTLGLYLSKKYNKELVIDLTKLNFINVLSAIGIKKDTHRDYELHKIGFIHPVKKIGLIEFTRKIKSVGKNKYVIADFRKSKYELGKVGENQDIYVVGWGDIRLINEVLPEMKAKFTANFELNPKIENALRIIRENNSIAVHIRRTDFLDPKISGHSIGICNENYYGNAIQSIKQEIEDPFFVYFSDDIEYVKNNFDNKNSYFVEGNAGYEDFYLMSMCKHFILANSTFSFWAAMLSKSEQKIVYSPEYWYNSPLRQADFIPDEWKKISIR